MEQKFSVERGNRTVLGDWKEMKIEIFYLDLCNGGQMS
jgi:hypothetical protein